MFKVKEKGHNVNIFRVFAVKEEKDCIFFLLYDNERWIWRNANIYEPVTFN
jgi:hypothetical protein